MIMVPPPRPVANPLRMAKELTKRELYSLVILHGLITSHSEGLQNDVRDAVTLADILIERLKRCTSLECPLHQENAQMTPDKWNTRVTPVREPMLRIP